MAAVLALAGVASMIVTAIIGTEALRVLVFSYENLLHRYYLWTPLTYALVNPPSLWLVLGCYLLWRFGEAVERHLGRAAFVRLILALLVALPILIVLLGFVGQDAVLVGINHLHFGVFLAFATLYPRAQVSLIIVTIEVWVLAAIIVGVYALGSLFARDWVTLLILATELAVAYGFIRHEQGRLKWPSLSALFPRPVQPKPERPQALPGPAKPKRTRRSERSTPEVDDILDKISREGMQSLTDDERIILERASHDLQKRKR